MSQPSQLFDIVCKLNHGTFSPNLRRRIINKPFFPLPNHKHQSTTTSRTYQESQHDFHFYQEATGNSLGFVEKNSQYISCTLIYVQKWTALVEELLQWMQNKPQIMHALSLWLIISANKSNILRFRNHKRCTPDNDIKINIPNK